MAEELERARVIRRPLPEWTAAIVRASEPLWIASTAALSILWGYDLIPRVIRALGHSGQAETIEWAVYMSMLVLFPAVCITIALALPRLIRGSTTTILKSFLILATLTYALVYAIDGRITLAAIALIPALITAITAVGTTRIVSERPTEGMVVLAILFVVSMLTWMSAGGLVYWTRATDWFLSSPYRFLALAVAAAIAIVGLPRLGDRVDVKAAPGVAFRIASIFSLLALVAFSFRTNPVVEFYHWGFWVGPIEQLRQGGWLLHDTPSQYGFLSILIPMIMPGSAWISFWYFQAVIYALVAVMMYAVFRRMRDGVGNLFLSTALVFTTLFFRPRTATLILPSQMTPSGGPVRFLWCFVLLGWLALVFLNRRRKSGEAVEAWTAPHGGFPLVGHIIWICSIAWSFEAAIYSSAIWFSAFAVYLLQQGAAERARSSAWGSVLRASMRSVATPAAMAISLYVVVWLTYRLAIGAAPDMHAYVEYGLLYSRGFGSLPIDTHGAIWYLILTFAIASTAVVKFLVEDWRDFRLVIGAGIWGGVWSLSSYFVSRSHPVNLLSLVPVLLYAVAILMIVIRNSTRREWHGYVRAASVPLIAIPIAMTLGHPGLTAQLETKQAGPRAFTGQIPLMDKELQSLLDSAGAKPSDSYVRMVDGRLMLPAWRGADAKHLMSERSWLPKPYEIIGSLDPARRAIYLDRNPGGGWLVHHATDTMSHFDTRFEEILKGRRIDGQMSRGPWTLYRIVPR